MSSSFILRSKWKGLKRQSVLRNLWAFRVLAGTNTFLFFYPPYLLFIYLFIVRRPSRRSAVFLCNSANVVVKTLLWFTFSLMLFGVFLTSHMSTSTRRQMFNTSTKNKEFDLLVFWVLWHFGKHVAVLRELEDWNHSHIRVFNMKLS